MNLWVRGIQNPLKQGESGVNEGQDTQLCKADDEKFNCVRVKEEKGETKFLRWTILVNREMEVEMSPK